MDNVTDEKLSKFVYSKVAVNFKLKFISHFFLQFTAEDDVYDVNDEVFSMAGNWRRLATGLRIPPRLVALIASNHSNDSEQCLLALLGEWLKQSYNVKRYGHPSWRALFRAVASSPGGGNPALAQTIAKKHPGRVIIN